MILGLMGVLHNMVQKIAEAREPMRDSGAVGTLQRFRSNTDDMISCKALILQVCLVLVYLLVIIIRETML